MDIPLLSYVTPNPCVPPLADERACLWAFAAHSVDSRNVYVSSTIYHDSDINDNNNIDDDDDDDDDEDDNDGHDVHHHYHHHHHDHRQQYC